MSDWISEAVRMLRHARHRASGWGYVIGQAAAVEPTALASLALLSLDEKLTDRREIESAASWLASLQNADGSLGIRPNQSTPHWPTAQALVLWACLGGYPEPRKRAVAWLLANKGRTSAAELGSVIGHDPSIQGWPWVEETAPWVEPTAWALLALRKEGHASHPRADEGFRLLKNRALSNGGWNFGNTRIFGKELRPQLTSTGLVCLAIAQREDFRPEIERACSYLLATLPTVTSAQSLSFGMLGLTALHRRPEQASAWLESSFREVQTQAHAPYAAAHLLLAADPSALSRLGLIAAKTEARP